MKTGKYILILMLLFAFSASYSQEPEKKSKSEKKLEQQKQTEELMNSKTFVFKGSTAFSEKGKTISITSGANTVSFSPELIKCDLPFFGEAKTASAAYGGQGGYRFEGKPDEFTLENTKKGWKLKAVVKTGNDTFTMNMTASPEGSANLNLYSINRSSMRYNGEVKKPE
jgi:hypothetical protein